MADISQALGPSIHTTVHTTFENGGFTLKTRHMFSVHTTLEEFKNATIIGQFRFVFKENSVREITWLSWRHRFQKAAFSKCFPVTRKRKAGVYKFLRFEERFRKSPFPWRISVDVFKYLRRSVDAARRRYLTAKAKCFCSYLWKVKIAAMLKINSRPRSTKPIPTRMTSILKLNKTEITFLWVILVT